MVDTCWYEHLGITNDGYHSVQSHPLISGPRKNLWFRRGVLAFHGVEQVDLLWRGEDWWKNRQQLAVEGLVDWLIDTFVDWLVSCLITKELCNCPTKDQQIMRVYPSTFVAMSMGGIANPNNHANLAWMIISPSKKLCSPWLQVRWSNSVNQSDLTEWRALHPC